MYFLEALFPESDLFSKLHFPVPLLWGLGFEPVNSEVLQITVRGGSLNVLSTCLLVIFLLSCMSLYDIQSSEVPLFHLFSLLILYSSYADLLFQVLDIYMTFEFWGFPCRPSHSRTNENAFSPLICSVFCRLIF